MLQEKVTVVPKGYLPLINGWSAVPLPFSQRRRRCTRCCKTLIAIPQSHKSQVVNVISSDFYTALFN